MIVSTDRCYYHKDKKVFSIEASDLRWKGFPAVLGLKSHRTGRMITCVSKYIKKDASGEDIQYVEYRPHMDIPSERPPFEKLIVFND